MRKEFLKKISLFSSLANDALEEIIEFLVEHRCLKGEVVFQEGDSADCLYLVFEGRVKIFKSSADGKEHTLRIMQKYDVIGEVPMFSEESYPASCVALSSSKLFSISRMDLLGLIKNDPDVALNMLALQAKRLREFSQKIEKLTLKNTEQRVADFFIKKSEISEGGEVVVDFTDVGVQDLANYLGISRENVSRTISRWVKLGLIDKKRNSVVVLDLEKLKDIMASG